MPVRIRTYDRGRSSRTVLHNASDGNGPTAVSAEISELLAGRSYKFRLVASNSEGTSVSADEGFITVAEPPGATTEPAVAGGTGAATLTGVVLPNGSAVTTCRFEYGTSSTGILEASVPCSSLPVNTEEGTAVAASVGGLAAGTTYHYRLVAPSVGGTSYGATLTFTTAATKLGEGGLEPPSKSTTRPPPACPRSRATDSRSTPAGASRSASSAQRARAPVPEPSASRW